jgi:hypothetical protein
VALGFYGWSARVREGALASRSVDGTTVACGIHPKDWAGELGREASRRGRIMAPVQGGNGCVAGRVHEGIGLASLECWLPLMEK